MKSEAWDRAAFRRSLVNKDSRNATRVEVLALSTGGQSISQCSIEYIAFFAELMLDINLA